MKPTFSARPILVVDDDDDCLNLIQLLLKRAKVTNPIVTARSAEEAKALLRQGCPAAGGRRSNKPILVLLDIYMPGASGFDLLKWIKRRKSFRRLKVVMWSSSTDLKDQDRATRLKADAFLLKFPSPQALGAIVRVSNESAPRRPRDTPES